MIKKLLLTAFFGLLINQGGYGQQLLWTSENGGTNQNGAVISYDLQTQQLTTVASLGGNFMGNWSITLDTEFNSNIWKTGGLIKGQDGYYYGINEFSLKSLTDSKGVFFRVNPANNKVELLHSFSSNGIVHAYSNQGNYASFNHDLRYPTLGIIETEPGVFYGIAAHGGLHNRGGIWKFDTNGNGYSKVGDFDTLNGGVGHDPTSPLIKGPNNDLYGVLKTRGTDKRGHLYKVDIANQKLEHVSGLSAAGWAITEPTAQIAYNSTLNTIFGTKDLFAGGNYGGGVYSYNFNTQTVTNETFISKGAIDVLGSNATGIIQANDGEYYFLCRNGGVNNFGTLVKYVPGVDTSTKLVDFTQQPNGVGMIAVGTKIYGSYDDTDSNKPLIWSYDVSSGIFVPNVVTGTDDNTIGYYISESFIVDGNKIIGSTLRGGDGSAGSLFEYNMSSGTGTAIQQHASAEGRGIVGEMLLYDNSTLYTYTNSGGPIDPINASNKREHGGIVKIDLVNNTAVFDSNTSDGYIANGVLYQSELRMAKAKNGKLFIPNRGLTSNSSRFTIYRVDSSTGASNQIYDIEPDDSLISSALEIEDNKFVIAYLSNIYIYDDNTGTTQEINPTYDANTNGNIHYNLTKASNGLLYALTKASVYTDSNTKASILEIDPSNWQITVKHSFETDVKETNIGLTEYNGKLWGSTISGGSNGAGYLYNIEISSGTFTKVHDFDYTNDGGAFMGQWTEHNGILYATSYTGGSLGYGTLASYDTNSSTFTVLKHLSLANGRSFKSTPLVWDPNSLSTSESNLKTPLRLYPNPTSSILNIDLKSIDNVKIYDNTGRLIKEVDNGNIDVSNFSNGMYFLKIRNFKGEFYGKFIKE